MRVFLLIRVSSSIQSLSGQVFVITGTLSRPRSDFEEEIKKRGGKLASSVSSKTSALILDDPQSGSSKAKTARDLGIPLWSEADLIKILGL